MIFGYLTLITALTISLSAAVYSILGLTAIFAAAFWPIVIMGGSLEVGKIVTTLWLHKYWTKAEMRYKVYLCSAVAVLMFLTSMGVFGYLSKAHTDQSLVGGDVQSKIAIYDEKIKTARENIEADRNQLRQMDAAVDQVMSRSSDEKGADKSNAIRRSQAKDRAALNKDIEANQKLIAQLNDESAPIRAEVRKVEAEVGPIKYIAAMVYGDNPDANLLEHAVRWVIILIVAVFDPLALTLLLAATKTFEWEHDIDLFNLGKKSEEESDDEESRAKKANLLAAEIPSQESYEIAAEDDLVAAQHDIEQLVQINTELATDNELLRKQVDTLVDQLHTSVSEPTKEPVQEQQESLVLDINALPKLINENDVEESTSEDLSEWDDFFNGTKSLNEVEHTVNNPVYEPLTPDPLPELPKPKPLVKPEPVVQQEPEDPLVQLLKNVWQAKNPEQSIDDHQAAHAAGEISVLPWHDTTYIEGLPISDGERKKLTDQIMSMSANLAPVADNVLATSSNTSFGTAFPVNAARGDLFLRVDRLPTVLYKFNGQQWIEVDKTLTDNYAYDDAYIEHLIEKVGTGEYDPDLLSDAEREHMAKKLNK